MKWIHLYKNKLGDYNIVLYPKTGKIYFQNVCLLKCPFWISRKKNLETYGERLVFEKYRVYWITSIYSLS